MDTQQIRKKEIHVRSDGFSRIFGIELTRMAALRTLAARDDRYMAELLARQIDWLACVINAHDENVTFDLRIVSLPCPDLYTRGRMRIALLCRINDSSDMEVRDRALQLLRLCESS